MKADGLSLLAGSSIESFSFDEENRGLSFPANPSYGQQWELTADFETFVKGSYTYLDGEWKFNGFSNISAYDIVGGCVGVMDDDAVLTRFICPRTIYLPANAFGAVASALTPGTGTSILSITVNTGYNINPLGTITFAGGATTGLVNITEDFAVDGFIRLNRGDVLDVVLSGSADTTLADVTYTISGFLNT